MYTNTTIDFSYKVCVGVVCLLKCLKEELACIGRQIANRPQVISNSNIIYPTIRN